MQENIFETSVAGKTLRASFNNIADQTNGSVMLTYGDTVVLATAVMSKQKKEGVDFFPLTVDYEEKFYAAGKILGSRFVRRETKPGEEATLTARVVDRTIRPLFPAGMRNEVQVVVTVLAIGEDDPDILAINAASIALATSDIPWNGPASAVRIVKDASTMIANPTYTDRARTDIKAESIVCGKDGNINMIEMGAQQIDEAEAEEMLKRAQEEIESFQMFQKKLVKETGKTKREIELIAVSDEVKALFEKEIAPTLAQELFTPRTDGEAKDALHGLRDIWMEKYVAAFPDATKEAAIAHWEEEVDREVHKGAVEKGKRVDGRAMDQIRPLYARPGGISPVLHGAGTFFRGSTHVVSVLTLGGPAEAQLIDGIEGEHNKRFMHHYNFPPFSTGEAGRIGVNRRMIGHGALAEKALSYVIPDKDTFPYTIRIVSEALASNGSTSMASVCASTVALMDAGVPIAAPVAGIAMGLMMHDAKQYKVLTDIQGPEDHYGDMDLKVAGTAHGVTAIQMDVKVDGVPREILVAAFADAKKARLSILEVITQAIPAPRAELAPSAPKILTIRIKQDQIGLVIGPGGKTINKIIDETGAEINIEEDGLVFITGKNGAAEKARAIIESLTHEFTIGERLEGTVTKLFDFGALVKIGPNTEGLVHISEIAPFRIEKVSDVVKEGDVVPVVVKEVDKEKGRIGLSIKQADPEFAKSKEKIKA